MLRTESTSGTGGRLFGRLSHFFKSLFKFCKALLALVNTTLEEIIYIVFYNGLL